MEPAAVRLDKLSKAFTPHLPIDIPAYLSGRIELLYQGIDAVKSPGLHAVLFGDRGTGKTSISKVLGAIVQEPDRQDGRRVLMTSCNSSDDFTSIWRKVFQEILIAPRQIGFTLEGRDLALHRFDSAQVNEPNDVRIMVQSLPNPTVIVIDEFDRVPTNTDARRLMADTIKLFADVNVPATIIIVGVAESLVELMTEHQSISRNIAQIPVEPMSLPELMDIIDKGSQRAEMPFEPALAQKIAELSQGFPHYTHLLGQWCGRRVIEGEREGAVLSDLDAAIPDALRSATGGVQQEYEKAVASGRSVTLYREVLLACALAPKDRLGKFSAVDVRGPLKKITEKDYSTGAFQSHLARFTDDERGPILRRSGTRRSYRWRFVNPQVIPYIVLEGKREKLIP